MVGIMAKVNSYNTLYSKNSEEKIIERLVELCGVENFRPKLEHLKELLRDDITHIESDSKIVVIAGTNGKGGTCHHLKNILKKQEHSYSLWTSPHVLTICERFEHNGSTITYNCLESLIDEHEEVARLHSLSFYEFLFYLYIKWIRTLSSDVVILEVGLGGRFDAVNIFTNPLTAIVSISLDHTEVLGKDLKSILFEKYGVVRQGGQLISGVEQSILKSLLAEWTARDEVILSEVERHEYSYEITNQRIALELHNALFGLKSELSSLHEDYTHKIMSNESKGRREKMTINARELIFIGAHNFDGHKKMLAELYGLGRESHIFVLGFSTGKEDQLSNIIDLYSQYPCLAEELILSDFNHPRAMNCENLKQFERRERVSLMGEKNLDWEFILTDESYKNKKIIISGSYFFIGEWQKYILDSYS